MSRKVIVFVLLVVLLSSCENKRRQVEPATVLADSVDSISFIEDSLFLIEPREPSLPLEGDETFEDFIYVFAGDTAFQRSRIIFPLPYYEEDIPVKIEQKDWTHDDLFIKQTYYTLLLDKEEELDHAADETRNSVQVEWIFLKEQKVKRYYFERKDGRWMLEAINLRPVLKSKRAGFVQFFLRFATDSLYQAQHIKDPLEFITTDPDDDFSIIETTLDIDQWFAFKPLLPNEKLSNIIYGQDPSDNSPCKILQLKGVGNGFLNTLFFRRKPNGKWELYKFEDTSN